MKVLHVDDYPVWFEVLNPLYVAKKWRWVNCNGAEEAIFNLDSSFDLLIADYNMPGDLSGVDVVLEAKKVGVDRIVMFTSDPESAKAELVKKNRDLAAEVLFFTKGNNFALFTYLDSLSR